MKKLKKQDIDKILTFHSKGLTNREIEKEIKIGRKTISKYLKLNALYSNWDKREEVKIVDDKHAQCSDCGDIKPIEEFQHNRKGQKYEYRFSFCNRCRKKRVYLNLNSNIDKYLKDRFNKLKRRASTKKIKFNISFDMFKNQFNDQKGKCFYTDELMHCVVGEGLKRNSLSIDKLVPELGYVADNVVFCTHKVNTIKSDLSMDELQKWIPKWYNKIKKHRKDL